MSRQRRTAVPTGDMLLLLHEVGDRIELAAHTDHWMRGDRFGTVTKVGERFVHVRLERSGRVVRVVPENIR